MRKKLLYLGFISIIVLICFLVLYYIFHIRHVPFQFECAMAIREDSIENSSFHYAPTEERFSYWIREHRVLDDLPPLIENPDLSLYDFERYDYLLFEGKKLVLLNYSPWLTHTEDNICNHEDSRTPLIPTLEDASSDTLYVYKIEKTNKFRVPGP